MYIVRTFWIKIFPQTPIWLSSFIYFQIMCKRYQTKDECMKVIDENCKYRPNIMSLDAGEVFIGGRYHRLVYCKVFFIVQAIYNLNNLLKPGTITKLSFFSAWSLFYEKNIDLLKQVVPLITTIQLLLSKKEVCQRFSICMI